ncbi:MAG: DUF2752 domain-containing protein [Bryobacteraceae bacterium]|jgi:hypothetical protein
MAARGILIRAAAAGLLLAGLCYFAPPDPGFRLCGFRWLTGRPCPFCGVTHALFALAKGHWGEAVRFNGLSPLALAMLFALPWNGRIRGHLWTAGLAAFAVYGVCRVVWAS